MSVEGVVEATAEALPAGGAGESAEVEGGDVGAEMAAFMRDQFGGEEDGSAEPEGAESVKAKPEKVEPKAEKPDEGDKAEAKSDESEKEKEDEAKAGADDEQPAEKRETGYQKKKRQLAEARAELEKTSGEVTRLRERDSQWQHVAETFKARAEESEARLRDLEARLDQHGLGDPPESRRVAELERQLREQQAEFQRQQREAQERVKRQAEAQQRARVQGLREQFLSVAESTGIDVKRLAAEVGARAEVARRTGQPPPKIEDVADELAEIDRFRAGRTASRQAEVSSSAPRPVRGGASAVPDFSADTAGMSAFLKSQGF